MKHKIMFWCIVGAMSFGALSSCVSLPNHLQAGVDAKQPDALVKAGQFYHKKDCHEKALAMFRAAAEQGVADAQNYCGRYYDEGWGVPKDDEKAVYWYTKAAEQNHVKAISNLALMYAYGEGVAQNKKKAEVLFRKALKLNPKEESAANGLFSLLNNGYAPENMKGKTLIVDYSNSYFYDDHGRRVSERGDPESIIKFTLPYKYLPSMRGEDSTEVTYRKTDRNTAVITYNYGPGVTPTYHKAVFDKPNQGRFIYLPQNTDGSNRRHPYGRTFRIVE